MEQAIKAEFSGDDLAGLLAICSFVRNGPVGEVAELLHKCIQVKKLEIFNLNEF